MNENIISDWLAQAETALNGVKNAQSLPPEDIANAREIVRQYEGVTHTVILPLSLYKLSVLILKRQV